MLNKKISHVLLSSTACLLLAACGTTSSSTSDPSQSSRIDSALERAAYTTAARGENNQSLAYLEKIYKRKSTDPEAAINYGIALRDADYLSRAALVLAPFADDKDGPAIAKTEYAAIQLAQGNYKGGEEYAQAAILQDNNNHRAYHYLGIALDAQGMHKEAERAFREGLDRWEGDPTSIMNNLALNLTSQGFLDEAAEILHKAQAVAPNKLEIERNLRIVTALQQSHQGYRAPKPHKKPEVQVMPEKAPVTEVEAAPMEEESEASDKKVSDKVVIPHYN